MALSTSSADGTAVVPQANYMFGDWPFHTPGSLSLVEEPSIGGQFQKQVAWKFDRSLTLRPDCVDRSRAKFKVLSTRRACPEARLGETLTVAPLLHIVLSRSGTLHAVLVFREEC